MVPGAECAELTLWAHGNEGEEARPGRRDLALAFPGWPLV